MTTKVKGYASKSGAKRAFVKAGGSIEGAQYKQTEDGKWYMVQDTDVKEPSGEAEAPAKKPAKKKSTPAPETKSSVGDNDDDGPKPRKRRTSAKKAAGPDSTSVPAVEFLVDWEGNLRSEDDEQTKAFEQSLLQGKPVPDVFVQDTDAGLVVIAGFHRAQAYLNMKAGNPDIELGYKVLSNDLTKAELIGIAVRENEGKPLTGIQRAKAYAKLRDEGLDINATAKEVGRSRADVEKYLILANATAPVLELVEDGTIAVLKAVEYVRKYGEDAHKHITKDLAKAVKKGKKKSAVSPAPQFPIKQARDFVKLLAERVRIDDEETTDEKVVFWGELTAEEWNKAELIIEDYKDFVEDNDPQD